MANNTKLTIKLSAIDPDEETYQKELLYLVNLRHLGVKIPEGFIITNEAFEQFLEVNGLKRKISDLLSTVHFQRIESVEQVANHIKKLVLNAKMPKNLEDELRERFKYLFEHLNKPAILINNQTKMVSFEKLLHEIKNVWASEFAPKHLLKKRQHILRLGKNNPILIQRLIDGKRSGKIFTSNLLIETNAKLNKDQVKMVTKLGEKIKKHFLLPQEVSWAIKGNEIAALAIKPQTNM